MSARERLLAAVEGADGAPVPCSFMMFRALRQKCRDEYEFATRQTEMGLDARMRLDDLPVRVGPEVTIREFVDQGSNGQPPVLTRTYETPAGKLTSSIKQIEGWPYGDRLPLFGDHITPRTLKHLISRPQDVEALRCVLVPPTEADIVPYLEEAAKRKEFAHKHGLLFCGGYRGERTVPTEDKGLVGANFCTVSVIDTLMWLCGGTEPIIWAYEQPDFLQELISFIEEWNRKRLEIHLEAGVELVFRRAWYEGTDFWNPRFYRQFILPTVRRDVELAHHAGVKYAYIITSGMMPVADLILEAGVDAIVGIDPLQGKGTTLGDVSDSLGGKVCLWGGVSGPLVVEEGSEEDVRAAVEEAISQLAPTGRFILSPVDNIRADTERSWQNVRVFVEACRSLSQENR